VKSVSVCVFVRDHIYTSELRHFLCMLPMAVARSSSDGAVMSMSLCISRFVDDVIFVHKLRMLSKAQRHRQAEAVRLTRSLEVGA